MSRAPTRNPLEPGVLDPRAERAFTLGACELLAVAIHDDTGWPLVKVTDAYNVYSRTDEPLEGEESDKKRAATTNVAGMGGSALHWMVLRRDGMLVDVDGAHDPLDVVEAYNDEADDGLAAIGLSSREDALEEAENKDSERVCPLPLARTFVTPVLERASSKRNPSRLAGKLTV